MHGCSVMRRLQHEDAGTFWRSEGLITVMFDQLEVEASESSKWGNTTSRRTLPKESSQDGAEGTHLIRTSLKSNLSMIESISLRSFCSCPAEPEIGAPSYGGYWGFVRGLVAPVEKEAKKIEEVLRVPGEMKKKEEKRDKTKTDE